MFLIFLSRVNCFIRSVFFCFREMNLKGKRKMKLKLKLKQNSYRCFELKSLVETERRSRCTQKPDRIMRCAKRKDKANVQWSFLYLFIFYFVMDDGSLSSILAVAET